MQKDKKIEGLKTALGVMRKGQTVPAVKLVQNNPNLAASISKLIHNNKSNNFLNEDPNNPSFSRTNMTAISNAIQDRSKDAQNVLQLFPDMELAIQILISCIISPKDLTSVEVNFTAPDGLLCSPILPALLTKISEHFERTHKIEPLLPEILRDALVEKGSYPVAVIPESTLDQLINSKSSLGNEDFSSFTNTNSLTGETTLKPIGVLGDPDASVKKRVGLESLSVTSYTGSYNSSVFGRSSNKELNGLLTVTDNILAFKTASILSAVRKQKINSCYNALGVGRKHSLESDSPHGLSVPDAKHLSRDEIKSLVYKRQGSQSKSFLKLTTPDNLSRDTVGNPLVLKLPAESVIPITVPGDPRHHVAYFVLIDEEGYPINSVSGGTGLDELQTKLQNAQSTSMGSFLLDKVNNTMQGGCKELGLDQATKIYSEIVEKDLLDRLRNGLHGNNVRVSNNDDVYRIMLSRALSNMSTQLVYVPVELMTYFTFKYYDSGVGKSILDDSGILNSLRAMTMLSRVMAQVRNAIGKVAVDVEFDEDDPDPVKTFEKIQDTIARSNAGSFPVGLQTAADIVDWMAKAGWRFQPGTHPRLPATKITYNNVESNFPEPDSNLEEELRKRSIQATGLSPETVDAGFGSDFATTIVANNALLNKRVKQLQEIFLPLLSQHCRQYALYSGGLMSNLRKVVKENWEELRTGVLSMLESKDNFQISEKREINVQELIDGDQDYLIELLLEELIHVFEVTLPSPDSNNLRVKIDMLKEYEELLDAALEARFSSKFMTDSTMGEFSGQADNIKEMIKAHYMRAFMDEQSIAPELKDLTVLDSNSNPTAQLFKQIADNNNDMLRAGLILLGKTVPISKAGNKDLENITGGDELTDSESYSSDEGNDTDTGGGDGFSDDSFDFDEPQEVTSETETTETTETTDDSESSSNTSDSGDDVLGITGLN